MLIGLIWGYSLSRQIPTLSVLLTYAQIYVLARKAPNSKIADFANTVDPDETAHNEPSHLDLQFLPSSL